MDHFYLRPKNRRTALIIFIITVIFTVSAEFFAHRIMTDFGSVDVDNVYIANKNGLTVRGKIYIPVTATKENQAPGIVYLHGYQNNRETSDPYAIELSRRGFVVLNIDTLGRGNSDNQYSEDEPGFDPTYGGDSAFEYLRALPFVDENRCGMGGHSLGGEMSYKAALENSAVKAIVFSGFAYREDTVTPDSPPNMLMIFGKYDEYRKRMTGTSDFAAEWMKTSHTRAAISHPDPLLDTTYGSFTDGTARRVHMTGTTHVAESFDRGALAEAVAWFSAALNPDMPLAIPPEDQVWRYKEVLSFLAMIAGFFSILPLTVLLMGIPLFRELAGGPGTGYICSPRLFRKKVTVNGLLMFLYIPSIMFFFAIHVYLFPLDSVLPMMMINGIVLWFFLINLIGHLIFRKERKKTAGRKGDEIPISLVELGLSETPDKIRLSKNTVVKILLMGGLLFAWIYFLQAGLEKLFLIDFRYKFPYASDLTPFRFLMFLEYLLPFFLGYIQFNLFLNGEIRGPEKNSFISTVIFRSVKGILVIIIPLLIHMAVQYIPLFLAGFIPFVGPGGVLVAFMINMEHMCVLLALMIPLSVFFYQITGKIWLGALVNALLVTWMFTSSSVIAPIPV